MKTVKTPQVEVIDRPELREQEFKVVITSRKTISPERLKAILEYHYDDVEVDEA